MELVKNSYDAHATKVEITFDDDYLRIADNGKGMSKDDLINKNVGVYTGSEYDAIAIKNIAGVRVLYYKVEKIGTIVLM